MNKPLVYAVVTFLFLFCLVIFFLTDLRKKDEMRYETLLRMTRTSSKQSPFGVKQERKGVHKQVFFSKDGLRHMILMQCPTSKISLTEGSELVEQLEDVKCQMQEKLYFDEQNRPKQEVRELQTKKALLSYQDQLFKGDDVTLTQFERDGHDLLSHYKTQKMLMQGKAQQAQFHLEEDVQFQASHLKATFFP